MILPKVSLETFAPQTSATWAATSPVVDARAGRPEHALADPAQPARPIVDDPRQPFGADAGSCPATRDRWRWASTGMAARARRVDVMSLARLDCCTSVRSRLVWVILLGSVALGIVGMHGLPQGDGSAGSVGHHVTQAADMVPEVGSFESPVLVGDDSSPGEDAGLLMLCLMVLASTAAVGLWLPVRSRVGGWRQRRVFVRGGLVSDVVLPSRRLWRQLSVLRI